MKVSRQMLLLQQDSFTVDDGRQCEFAAKETDGISVGISKLKMDILIGKSDGYRFIPKIIVINFEGITEIRLRSVMSCTDAK